MRLLLKLASGSWQLPAAFGWGLVLLAVALVVSNAVLIQQNRELRRLAQAWEAQGHLSAGDALPWLQGIDPQGNDLRLETKEGTRKTVLLLYHPKCGWCRKNVESWKTLVAQSSPEEYRFAAVSTRREGAQEFLDAHRIQGLPVIAELDPRTRVEYKLSSTPQTIVIDDRGKVERIWVGALTGSSKSEAERYFRVELPELGE